MAAQNGQKSLQKASPISRFCETDAAATSVPSHFSPELVLEVQIDLAKAEFKQPQPHSIFIKFGRRRESVVSFKLTFYKFYFCVVEAVKIVLEIVL